MKIIITAAGKGQRFVDIGIKKPKYEIIANKKSLFYWSIISLKKFFNEEFIFIFYSQNFKRNWIVNELKKLGIKKYKIVLTKKRTRGQAETVLLAKKYLKNNDSIMIYNIDTHVDSDSINKKWFLKDGLIVTTNAPGEHWSFAKTSKNDMVVKVTEKIKISNHASIGLYYFKKFSDFLNVFKKYCDEIIKQYKEIYICPMYQYLIDSGKKILAKDIPFKNMICLGTPKEVLVFDSNFLKNN